MKGPFAKLNRYKRLLVLALVIGLMAWTVRWIQARGMPRAILPETFEKIIFAPDGATFVTVRQLNNEKGQTTQSQIRLWETDSCAEKMAIVLPDTRITWVAYSAEKGKIAVLIQNQEEEEIRIWDTKANNEAKGITSNLAKKRVLGFHSLFYSHCGNLMGFKGGSFNFFNYEIWNIDWGKKVFSGLYPSWCSLYPLIPFCSLS